ncbi:MAG: glycosyltransferase family 4 protein [Phycisphaeraceae bacterium]
MRVLMLGWEFPPHITGGLGTACAGLTRALSELGDEVTFVLPQPVEKTGDEPVRVVGPEPASPRRAQAAPPAPPEAPMEAPAPPGYEQVAFRQVPARLPYPYPGRAPTALSMGISKKKLPEDRRRELQQPEETDRTFRGDPILETQRYARMCVLLARREPFDVIHAHDWMTFPAAMAVARASGKPLVVQVHSTEIDRAGDRPNQAIVDIERRGMHAATRVIAVSRLTAALLEHRYGVEPERIAVVHNAVAPDCPAPQPKQATIKPTDKLVLFLGRVTDQKGPSYFLHAAKKVLEKHERVKFVVAGVGDRIADMIDLADRLELGEHVIFTGFLTSEDVDRVFEMADVYVMPSVSEPFGIAALEAVQHEVPVVVSRTSGVTEVLKHALKVDFWDAADMADKVIAVLRHPPLAATMRHFADIEVQRLTWKDAAERCDAVYRDAVEEMNAEQKTRQRRPAGG